MRNDPPTASLRLSAACTVRTHERVTAEDKRAGNNPRPPKQKWGIVYGKAGRPISLGRKRG